MTNSLIDIFHNVFSIAFFLQVLYLSFGIISSEKNNTQFMIKQYDLIYFYSTIFFIISGIINIFDKSYLFIIHHIISWISIYYGYIYRDPDYIYWMSQNFLAEISSIFLSIDIIIKNIWKKKSINFLKIVFFVSYTLVRIIYLMPINFNFLLNYRFEDNYKYFLPISFYFMIGLNIYWFILIIKKLISTLFCKKL